MLYVRLVIIMLRTTITRHGQRLSALPLSHRFAVGVGVLKVGPAEFKHA